MAGGCVNLKTHRDGEVHYVMVSGMDKENMYIFDPYYKEESNNNFIKIENANPLKYNRIVKIEYFISDDKKELALGPEDEREAVYFCRNDEVLEREFF